MFFHDFPYLLRDLCLFFLTDCLHRLWLRFGTLVASIFMFLADRFLNISLDCVFMDFWFNKAPKSTSPDHRKSSLFQQYSPRGVLGGPLLRFGTFLAPLWSLLAQASGTTGDQNSKIATSMGLLGYLFVSRFVIVFEWIIDDCWLPLSAPVLMILLCLLNHFFEHGFVSICHRRWMDCCIIVDVFFFWWNLSQRTPLAKPWNVRTVTVDAHDFTR